MMKKYVIILGAIVLSFASCKKIVLVDRACGVDDPIENIQWLNELINKAEADTTLRHYVIIFLEEFDGNDAFYIRYDRQDNYGSWFTCEGERIEGDSLLTPVFKRKIYSTDLE